MERRVGRPGRADRPRALRFLEGRLGTGDNAAMPDPAALLRRRSHLPAQGTTFYRAAHTTETGGDWALDLAGDCGVLSLYRPMSPGEERELAQRWGAAGLRSVYVKRRPPEARHLANVARGQLSPPHPLWGEAQETVTVLENGVPFLIRPGSDLSVGLFSDARGARAWVRGAGAGRVLNLFAYTCGFGLSAALGGTTEVKNVDLSRRVLSWGQENYALSGLPAPDTDFLYGDVFGWLPRLAKRARPFDLVVLDPPSFARRGKEVWRAAQDYASLVAGAAALTAPGGRLLCLLNHAGLTHAGLDRQVRAGLSLAGRPAHPGPRWGAGEDYPDATHLKVQVWEL